MSQPSLKLGKCPMKVIELEAIKPPDYSLKANSSELSPSSIRLLAVINGSIQRFKCTPTVFSAVFASHEDRRPVFDLVKVKVLFNIPEQPSPGQEEMVTAMDVCPIYGYNNVLTPRDNDERKNIRLVVNKSGFHITEAPYYMPPSLFAKVFKQLRELDSISVGDKLVLDSKTTIRLTSVVDNELVFLCPKSNSSVTDESSSAYAAQQKAVQAIEER